MIYSAPPPNDTAHSTSHHANLHALRGTQPGLLDPSQPSRLLRSPDSKLSFASFDPKTALPEDHSLPKFNSSGNLPPPKRIVLETTSRGACFWRFVPRARLEEGAQDEGVWPRVIDLCGENVQCYQEQWEIYKLDPKYQCVVYPWPKCSTVTWVQLPDQGCDADPYSGKRSRWSSPETSEPITLKKARPRPPDETDETSFDSDSSPESDEDEVEQMIVDESFSQKPRTNPKPQATRREKLMKKRLERWTKNRMTHEKQHGDTVVPADGSFTMRVDTPPSQDTPWPTEDNLKRKDNSSSGSDHNDHVPNERHKRARTSPRPLNTRKSPSKTYRDTSYGLLRKRPLNRSRRNPVPNRQYQQEKFAGFTYAPSGPVFEGEQDEGKASTTETHSGGKDDAGETPQEADSHETDIAESIRKLRELEKDRPLWEVQRKLREAREHAEEQERVAKAERRRREEQRFQQQREAAEREKMRMQEESERVAREEQHRQRQQRQRQRWESGPWTTHRALERYRMLSDEFDTVKFASGQSITFHDIPWPVLHAPSRMTVEDVDWSAVEAFFVTVKSHMRMQDYKEFVEKSHRRFHPDRWRARRIWGAVTDEVERGYLEVAANTVAQAITPIWRAAKE